MERDRDRDFLKLYLRLFPIYIGVFMVMLDASILNVALPRIAEDFNAKTSDVQWIQTSYTLTLVSLYMIAARIGDMVPREKYYISGMLVFTFGSYLCAQSWNIASFIFSRVLQAIGGAIMTGNSLAIMAEAFPPGKRGTVMGINAILIASSFSIGPLLGGWLTTNLSWHWVFYINVPIGIFASLLGFAILPRLGGRLKEKIDFVGAILLTVATASLTLGIIKGQDWGWMNEKTLACFIISIPYFFAFALRELSVQNPLLDIYLFRIRNFTVAILGISITFLGMASSLFILPFYLQGIKGLSAQEAGYWMFSIPIVNTFVAPIAGRLSDKINPKYMMSLSPIFFSLGLYSLSFLDANTSYWEFFARTALLGVGMGLMMSPAMNVIMSSIPPTKAGMANGVIQTINSLSQTLGVAIGGVLLTESMKSLIPGYGNQLPDPGTIMMVKILAVQFPYALYMIDAFMEGIQSVLKITMFIPLATLFIIVAFLSGKEHMRAIQHASGRYNGFS